VPHPAARLLLAAQVVLFLPTSTHAADALPLPAVARPTGGGGSVVLEPVKQQAQPTRRLVYSCVAPGLVTFSDRPCGPLPKVRELSLDQPVPAAAGAAPELGKAATHTPVSRRTTVERDSAGPAAVEVKRVTACHKLQATLDDLDSRMRTGYSAREAGRLWQRWRDAKARLHEANC
jgi:hypothetical protein